MAAVLPLATAPKGSRILAEWNAQRRAERAVRDQAARYSRQFAGAAINRLTASMAQWSGAVNADLDAGLAILRSRARSLCANNEFGRRFLTMVKSNVVGPFGPTLQVRVTTPEGTLDSGINGAVEAHWHAWCRAPDLTGRMSFANLLHVLVSSCARDGESLVRFVRGRDQPYGLALQILEADRIDDALNQRLSNGNIIRMGVEMNPFGRPVALHVKTSHPGENYDSVKQGVERVSVADILHPFVVERAEQVRGYTWMHAVLIRTEMLHGFEEAAVIAARVGASKMGFFTRTEESDPRGGMNLADGKDESTGLPQMGAEPGEFLELPIGYDFKTWNPDYPHQNFESFLKTCLRGLSAGLDVATHNLSGDMTEVNYSSARIAELAERDVWRMLQQWLIDSVIVRIYHEWLRSAFAVNALTFASGKNLPPDRVRSMYDQLVASSRFQGRTWSWVDPLKDVQSAKEQIAAGLTSRTQVCAAQGVEFEDVVGELRQERAALEAAGLPVDMKGTTQAPPPDQSGGNE